MGRKIFPSRFYAFPGFSCFKERVYAYVHGIRGAEGRIRTGDPTRLYQPCSLPTEDLLHIGGTGGIRTPVRLSALYRFQDCPIMSALVLPHMRAAQRPPRFEKLCSLSLLRLLGFRSSFGLPALGKKIIVRIRPALYSKPDVYHGIRRLCFTFATLLSSFTALSGWRSAADSNRPAVVCPTPHVLSAYRPFWCPVPVTAVSLPCALTGQALFLRLKRRYLFGHCPWWACTDLNRSLQDYEPCALTAVLQARVAELLCQQTDYF